MKFLAPVNGPQSNIFCSPRVFIVDKLFQHLYLQHLPVHISQQRAFKNHSHFLKETFYSHLRHKTFMWLFGMKTRIIIFVSFGWFFAAAHDRTRTATAARAAVLCRSCSPLQVCNRSRHVKLFPNSRCISEEMLVWVRWHQLGRSENWEYAYGSSNDDTTSAPLSILYACRNVYAVVKPATEKTIGSLWIDRYS